MGCSISVVNDTHLRCNVRVLTVGSSFVVTTINVLPGEQGTRKLQKLWYNLVCDFGRLDVKGKRSALHWKQEGIWIGSNMKIKLSEILSQIQQDDSEGAVDDEIDPPTANQHAATQDGGDDLSKEVLEVALNASPAAVFNLTYKNSDFAALKDKDGAMEDKHVSDWTKTSSGLEERSMSYIKNLNSTVGPSKTKCEITEAVEHYDEDQYISVLSTTKNPDVPYGESFETKTRTCFTWSAHGGTTMRVTADTVWKSSSIMKSVIDKSSLDGQKKANELVVSLARKWISDHPDDFKLANTPAGHALEEDVLPHQESRPSSDNSFNLMAHLLSPVALFLLCTNLFTLWYFLRSSGSNEQLQVPSTL